MDAGLKDPTAAVYRLDGGGQCHKKDTGIIVSSGIAWSPDNRTMYFSDTRAEALYTYDFGLATGEFANRKVLVDTSDKPFRIDRATVDMQGFYSGAQVHDRSIGKYAPDGTQVDEIRLPVRQPTSAGPAPATSVDKIPYHELVIVRAYLGITSRAHLLDDALEAPGELGQEVARGDHAHHRAAVAHHRYVAEVLVADQVRAFPHRRTLVNGDGRPGRDLAQGGGPGLQPRGQDPGHKVALGEDGVETAVLHHQHGPHVALAHQLHGALNGIVG